MSDGDGKRQTDEGGQGRTRAELRRSRWPGWIWAVPIAAIAIVGWLGVRHFLEQGPSVTIVFPKAAGIEAGSTEVRYQGLKVGTVEAVALGEQREDFEVSVRFGREVDGLLREGTRFWLVGGEIGLDNLSGIKTLISGPYIEMSPGEGAEAERFQGELQPPTVPPDAEGSRFLLRAGRLGSLGPGAAVTYLGKQVGSVVETRLDGSRSGFEIEIFLERPNDALVGPDSRFWDAGGLRLSLSGGGLEAGLASPQALLNGRIAFETPGLAAESAAAPTDGAGLPEGFRLYPDHETAVAGTLDGSPYRLDFDGAVGELEAGQPVTFRGFVVGRVTGAALRYDAERGRLETPVTVEVDAGRLGAPDGGLETLVAQGLRARLERRPPLIGAPVVTLTFDPDAEPAQPAGAGEAGLPRIPTVASGGLDGLTRSAQGALEDVRQMQLPQTARDIREAVGRAGELIRHADQVVTSPELERSLANLDRALADLEAITSSAEGRVGPTLSSLREAAAAARSAMQAAEQLLGGTAGAAHRSLPGALEEIAGAARALRVLAEYLERHPEALLQGRSR